VIDRASFEDPFQYPEGISVVAVNGRVTLRDGERLGTGAGKGLRPAGG
jgi:N-acyl-D-amino-acid deacylase